MRHVQAEGLGLRVGMRRRGGLILGVAACSAFLLGSAASVGAQTRDAGAATIVTADGSSIGRGDQPSAAAFSLRLPKGASCPGDSANGGYRVQSFIVPAASDPGTLHYKSTGPDASGQYALFDTFTRGYVQVQTANADTVGGPGVIVNVPSFSYAVFSPGMIAEGTHHIGIACTLINDTVKYWSTDIVVTSAAADKPAGFRWRAADPASTTSGRSSRGLLALVGVAAAAAIAVVALYRRRAGRELATAEGSP
jgi:hypothetical protein